MPYSTNVKYLHMGVSLYEGVSCYGWRSVFLPSLFCSPLSSHSVIQLSGPPLSSGWWGTFSSEVLPTNPHQLNSASLIQLVGTVPVLSTNHHHPPPLYKSTVFPELILFPPAVKATWSIFSHKQCHISIKRPNKLNLK